MTADKKTSGNRERLILAGISLLNRHGLGKFSLRAVAASCGLSCAAPYRHFKNKNDLVLAILSYINDAWHKIQSAIIESEQDLRSCLIRISVAYIRFLVENPSFRVIILGAADTARMTPEQRNAIGKLSERTSALIRTYACEAGLSEEAAFRKTSAIRALIYGYTLMFVTHELAPSAENYAMIEAVVSREFDLS